MQHKNNKHKRVGRPTPPKRSVIEHVASGVYCNVPTDGSIPSSRITDSFTIFPSRTQALKALAKFIPKLPAKGSKDEPDLYRVKIV